MKNDDTRRDATVARELAPAEGAALAAVTALMAERRRYEAWLASLQARRATTPDHVFERVHLDYTTRLEAVIVQLTSHADDLGREMQSLTSRLSGLTTDHQRAEDERAEAELRAHVGELSAEDWVRAAAASDESLAELAARRSEAEQELARTRELLDSTVRPAALSPAPAVVPARVSKASAAPPQPTAAPVVESPDTPSAEAPTGSAAPEQRLLEIEDRSTRPSVPVKAQPEPILSSPETDLPPAPTRRATGFDELAFLSSVVDTPAGTFDAAPVDEPDEKSRRDTFARRSQEDAIVHLADGTTPLGSAIIEREGESLLASGGGGASAIRRDSSADGVKSLKCSECAAMNYPTEWYCERCGAELASL